MTGNDLLLALIPPSGDAFRARSLESAHLFLVPISDVCAPTPAHGYSFDLGTREAIQRHLVEVLGLIEHGAIEYDDKWQQVALFAAERPSRPEGQDALDLLRKFAVTPLEDE